MGVWGGRLGGPGGRPRPARAVTARWHRGYVARIRSHPGEISRVTKSRGRPLLLALIPIVLIKPLGFSGRQSLVSAEPAALRCG
jgi:hypothetical protein